MIQYKTKIELNLVCHDLNAATDDDDDVYGIGQVAFDFSDLAVKLARDPAVLFAAVAEGMFDELTAQRREIVGRITEELYCAYRKREAAKKEC